MSVSPKILVVLATITGAALIALEWLAPAACEDQRAAVTALVVAVLVLAWSHAFQGAR